MNPANLTQGNISIRPASVDDFEQMVELEKDTGSDPWSFDHFVSESQKPYSRMLVLTDDETDSFVVGYIIYWIQVEGVSLLNIHVNSKWRGLGLAQRLMHAMINETVRDEIPRIVLEVREGNDGAIRLYEKLGFKKTHERPKFYSSGETAIVMEIKTSDLNGTVQ
jgi:ribosomal-protein-alanine N-acetyltransferase